MMVNRQYFFDKKYKIFLYVVLMQIEKTGVWKVGPRRRAPMKPGFARVVRLLGPTNRPSPAHARPCRRGILWPPPPPSALSVRNFEVVRRYLYIYLYICFRMTLLYLPSPRKPATTLCFILSAYSDHNPFKL